MRFKSITNNVGSYVWLKFYDSSDNLLLRFAVYESSDFSWDGASLDFTETMSMDKWWDLRIKHDGSNMFNVSLYQETGEYLWGHTVDGKYAGDWTTFSYIVFTGTGAQAHNCYFDNIIMVYDVGGYDSGYPRATGVSCNTDQFPKLQGQYDQLFYTFNTGSESGSKILVELKNDSDTVVYINQLSYPQGVIGLHYDYSWGYGNFTWVYSDWYYGSDASRYYEEINFYVVEDTEYEPIGDYNIWATIHNSNLEPTKFKYLDVYWSAPLGESVYVRWTASNDTGSINILNWSANPWTGTGETEKYSGSIGVYQWLYGDTLLIELVNATTHETEAYEIYYYTEYDGNWYLITLSTYTCMVNDTVRIVFTSDIQDTGNFGISIYLEDIWNYKYEINNMAYETWQFKPREAGNYTIRFTENNMQYNPNDDGEHLRVYPKGQTGGVDDDIVDPGTGELTEYGTSFFIGIGIFISMLCFGIGLTTSINASEKIVIIVIFGVIGSVINGFLNLWDLWILFTVDIFPIAYIVGKITGRI